MNTKVYATTRSNPWMSAIEPTPPWSNTPRATHSVQTGLETPDSPMASDNGRTDNENDAPRVAAARRCRHKCMGAALDECRATPGLPQVLRRTQAIRQRCREHPEKRASHATAQPRRCRRPSSNGLWATNARSIEDSQRELLLDGSRAASPSRSCREAASAALRRRTEKSPR